MDCAERNRLKEVLAVATLEMARVQGGAGESGG